MKSAIAAQANSDGLRTLPVFRALIMFVGCDDALDEGMTNDVGFSEMAEGNAFDRLQDFFGHCQARGLIGG